MVADPAPPRGGWEATPDSFQRLLRWLVQQPPRTFGWCRTRWSCAALALTITARIGLSYSRETVRRELHSQGWEWKRAKLKAKDDDPERARKLARTGATIERLRRDEAFFWVDELDIHLLAKVGYQWMLKGTQVEIPTPGQNRKQYLAGALDLRTGEIHYVIGPGKNNLLFRQLLALLSGALRPADQTPLCGRRQLQNSQGQGRRSVARETPAGEGSLAAELLPESEPD